MEPLGYSLYKLDYLDILDTYLTFNGLEALIAGQLVVTRTISWTLGLPTHYYHIDFARVRSIVSTIVYNQAAGAEVPGDAKARVEAHLWHLS